MKTENSKLSVLCAMPRSVYHQFSGIDVYDQDRNAYTFPGGMPVIAHPPCRLWSLRLRHFAKSNNPTAERGLGLWCVDQVQRWGGVLEQPYGSKLWEAAGLPLPGSAFSESGFSFALLQYWFGHKVFKPTWIYVVGRRDLPALPFRLASKSYPWNNLSMQQRQATPELFAVWLIEVARGCVVKTGGYQHKDLVTISSPG